VGGSASVNVLTINTTATIDDDAVVSGSGGITVSATDVMTLFTGAGALGLSLGGVGVGVAVNVDVVTRNTLATVGAGAELDSSGGNILVNAGSTDNFTSVVATFGASSSDVAVALSAGVLVLTTTTRAEVENGAADDHNVLDAAGDITVSASSTLDMDFIAGGGAASLGGAGIGIAASVLVHFDTVEAKVGNYTDITTGGATGLSVNAYSHENVLDLVVAAAVSGSSVGVGASVLVSVMTETTKATIGNHVNIDAWNASVGVDSGVFVEAEDHTEMLSVAGSVAVGGGSAGVGAGVNVHTMIKTTEASIGSDSTIGGNPGVVGSMADGNIVVDAESSEVFKTFAVSAAGGSTVGVGIGADVMVLDLTTSALIGARTVAETRGSVKVQAVDETEVDMIVVGVAVGGTGAVGAGAGVAVIGKTIEAAIGEDAEVTGLGHSTVSARTGQYAIGSRASGTGVDQSAFTFETDRPTASNFEVGLPDTNTETDLAKVSDPETDTDKPDEDEIASPDMSAERTATLDAVNVRGVVVSASGKDDVESYAIGFAGGGTVAVGIGASVSKATTVTTATIGDRADINQSGTGVDGQSVFVVAATDFSHVGVGAGGAASGTVAGAPGVDVSVINQTTSAAIGMDTMVDAEEDVIVTASAKEDFFIVGLGIAVSGVVGWVAAWLWSRSPTQLPPPLMKTPRWLPVAMWR